MTPKEKARELFDKYQIAGSQWYVDVTKKYCIIAVDEILNEPDCSEDYWQEVKREIERL